MQLHLEAYGDVQVSRQLLRFADQAINLSPALEDVEQDFYDIEREQFGSQGARGSGGWPALSDDYARWKAANYPGKPILQREGELFESLTGGGDRRLSDDELMIVGAPHGKYHQNARPPRKQRRPVELMASDRRRWVKIIQSHIVGSPGSLRGLEGIL